MPPINTTSAARGEKQKKRTRGGESEGRSWPIPDADAEYCCGIYDNIRCKLENALSTEIQHNMNYERRPGEVTLDDRDGAVHVLRSLRVWFDLPPNVYFLAVYYLDHFLARVKVQQKYLPCVTISCFHVAAEKRGIKLNASQLVMLSQSRCTVKDMERMSTIITQKLNVGDLKSDNTALDMLTMYLDIVKACGTQLKNELLLNAFLKNQYLYTRLEYLVADSLCASFKPSILTLAFLHFEIEKFSEKITPSLDSKSTQMYLWVLIIMIELLSRPEVDSGYKTCFEAVSKILKAYDSSVRVKQGQKLIWRFSTTYTSKLSQNFYSVLHTIKE